MTDDLTTAIHTYLTTAPASGFAGQEVRVVESLRGADNLLWRVVGGGREAAAKFFLDAGQARGRRQFDGQRLFAPLGLAPEPLWVDRYPDGLARQVLVYRWADGAAIDGTDGEALARLAEAAAAIHSHDAGDVRRFCPRPVNLDYFWRMVDGGMKPVRRWCAKLGCVGMAALVRGLGDRAGTVADQALPLWQTAPPTPVHGDLSLANSLTAGTHVTLVDWEMFGLGDPALEVAYFLHDSRPLLPASALAAWRERYLASSHDARIGPRIDAYEKLLPLHHLLFLLNGLRRLTPDERVDPDFRSRGDFLAETIQLATDAALTALDIQPPSFADELPGEVRRLIS